MLRKYSLLIVSTLLFNGFVRTQNINYNARITEFRADCESDFLSDEEFTWWGYLADNLSPESTTGCVQRSGSSDATATGTFVSVNRENTPAITLRGRLDAWEDDTGSRCTYNSGDDCRSIATVTESFPNPLEYISTVASFEVNGTNMGMTVVYSYLYAREELDEAVELTTGSSFQVSGNRPFWGCKGNWANVGSDCAASGTIGDNQFSAIRYNTSCQSQVRFRWRVSSQFNRDWLAFYDNNQLISRISGEINWTEFVYDIPADNRNHQLEWRYQKDGNGRSGLDRGFIDFIRFTNASTIDAGTIGGDQTITAGDDPGPLTDIVPFGSNGNVVNVTWQRSTDQQNWITASSGATPYNPGPLSTTTYYRRFVQDNCLLEATSNVVTITVEPALPIELSYFEVRNVNPQTNDLRWETRSERNNDYFEIERSQDGGNTFLPITRLPGAGDSREPTRYYFQDRALPAPSELYYRLKQVDMDGNFSYSNVSIVRMQTAPMMLTVFPNPARDLVNYRFTATGAPSVQLILYNLKGTIVKRITLAPNGSDSYAGQIPLTELANGLYTLSCLSDNGQQLGQKRVIVSH